MVQINISLLDLLWLSHNPSSKLLSITFLLVFREENAGRLADDLAMGTGIRISNVNAGRLANDPAIVQSDELVTKMVFAFQLTSPWVQS